MSDYQPISCEFHDVLEALATQRKEVVVEYRDAEGGLHKTTAAILDVFAQDKAEYASLTSGEKLRLDQLVAVDGAKLADF